jgi:GT2 family glycosyltransferase
MSFFSYEVTTHLLRGDISELTSDTSGFVLSVVVLYNRSFKDVPCAPRLEQWLAAPRVDCARLRLAHCLIYDNSPIVQSLDLDSQEGIELFHDASNGGTQAAYVHALKIAQIKGCPWILFLDHDTDLPHDFFLDAEHALTAAVHPTHICAIVPRVFDGFSPISPSRLTSYGRVYASQAEQIIFEDGVALTAIASASIVRTASLASVLPIPAFFTLDYLDHWLFRELQLRGESIAVSSARVEHSLSVQSMKSMDLERYRAILAAELVFLRGYSQYSLVRHFFWHIGRTLKLMLLTRRPHLVGICVRAALKIITQK